MSFEFRSLTRLLTALLLAGALAGCGSAKKAPALGQTDADKFLFDRGTALLAKKNWITAREYFRRIVDSYPRSTYRADAKLGVGDSYLGEKGIDSLILAVNEFREFLTYFPLNPRADYAQYHLALAQSKQMLHPERDQTATVDTLREIQKFIDTYPSSPYRPEVDKLYRQARDRLSESEFRVGMLYLKSRWVPGALARFSGLMKDDPGYTRMDDVYFYTGEAFMKAKAWPQALPMYDRLLTEFPKSKHANTARKRIAEGQKQLAAIKR